MVRRGCYSHFTYCHAFNRCCRKAVSTVCQYRQSAHDIVQLCRLLGGRLLFVFLWSSRAGSWLDIESVCSTWSVRDMVVYPRDSAVDWWRE